MVHCLGQIRTWLAKHRSLPKIALVNMEIALILGVGVQDEKGCACIPPLGLG